MLGSGVGLKCWAQVLGLFALHHVIGNYSGKHVQDCSRVDVRKGSQQKKNGVEDAGEMEIAMLGGSAHMSHMYCQGFTQKFQCR